jgi:ABC-type transport system involved in multi-copper enzyme maturation permease subunit
MGDERTSIPEPASPHPLTQSPVLRPQSSLLRYRAWRGEFDRPTGTIWPIARVALHMMFRRKLFWVLYGLGMLVFCVFFFGQYLLAFAEGQLSAETLPVAIARFRPQQLVQVLGSQLKMNGSAETFLNYIWLQGYMVTVILALAGSVLVGNDFQFGSLPFYLSKPLGRWHYLLGKCLAVAVFINLMTTIPAFLLWVEYGLLHDWEYFWNRSDLLIGIASYGLVLTVTCSLVLVATATWLRRTIPMIMVWTTLLLFSRMLATALVDRMQFSPRWRLIDLWSDAYIVGNYLFGFDMSKQAANQPTVFEAALALAAVSLLCLSYVNQRIRAVEVVA